VNQGAPRAKRFRQPHLGEAVRVMPLAMRVVGLDASADEPGSTMDLWPARPPLRLEGVAARDPGVPKRRVRGRVCMTGDGRVRWTLVRALFLREGRAQCADGMACSGLRRQRATSSG
jgi:hypothetical protein